jgi:hypothetical protein
MAATAAQLEAALANFLDNLDSKLDVIVNGDSSTDVTTDSGTVPTIAKLFNQMTSSLTAGNNEFTAIASQTDFVCTGKDIPGVNSVIVTVDGNVQEASTYTIQTTTTSNDTVRLASGLAGGELVQVRLLAAPQSIGTTDANAVTYNQGSTGSSSRFVEDKFQKELLSVIDFGADPTGATTSATAFTNAMNEAMSTGRTLFVPAGSYDIGAWTVLTTTGALTMVGEVGTTITWSGGGTGQFVRPEHSTIIRDIEFADWDSVIRTTTSAATGTRIDRLEITGCKFTGSTGDVIFSRVPVSSARIAENIFDGTGTAMTSDTVIEFGIGGTEGDGKFRNVVIENNLFENIDVEAAASFRFIHFQGEYSRIVGNMFRNNDRTLNTNNVEVIKVAGHDNIISGNVLNDFGTTVTPASIAGILVTGVDRGVALTAGSVSDNLEGHSNVIRENFIGNHYSTAAAVNNCNGINNITQDVQILGNIIQGIAGATHGAAIYHVNSSATESVVVRNNIIRSEDAASNHTRDGIYLDTDGQAVVSGNAIYGFKRYGFYLNSDSTGALVAACGGNVVDDAGQGSEGSAAGIRLQRGAWTCTGNTVNTTQADYGIYVAATTDGCVVTGNRSECASATGIRLVDNSASGEGHLVTGNSIQNSTTGITQDSGGDHKVNNNIIDGAIDTIPGVIFAGVFSLTRTGTTWSVASSYNEVNYASFTSVSVDNIEFNFTTTEPDANYMVIPQYNGQVSTWNRSTNKLGVTWSDGSGFGSTTLHVICYRI